MHPTVFTTLLIERGKVQNLPEHLSRLHAHARILKIPILEWKPHFLSRFLSNYPIQHGQYRLKIFLNEDNYSFELSPYEHQIPNGYRLVIHPNPITHRPIKCHPYTDRDGIYQSAIAAGYDEALTLSPESYILETAYANFFWRFNNQLFTPDPSLPLLYGITIQKLSPIPLKLPFNNLPETANLYLCNSLRKIQPIIAIENKQFPRDFAFEKKLSYM